MFYDSTNEVIKKYLFVVFQTHLLTSPMCKPCSRWEFESAETWGLRYDGIGVAGTVVGIATHAQSSLANLEIVCFDGIHRR